MITQSWNPSLWQDSSNKGLSFPARTHNSAQSPKVAPSHLVVRLYANNEIRLTWRSDIAAGKTFDYFPGESEALAKLNAQNLRSLRKPDSRFNSLTQIQQSSRHSRYADNLPQSRKNKCDRIRALLLWLSEIEGKDGQFRCPVPDIFSYLPVNSRYSGQKVKSERLTFISYPDGTLEGWDTETGQQIIDLEINKAKERLKNLLVIIGELQENRRNPRPIGFDNPKRMFTRRARKKLLEAGAVVDDLCPTSDPLESVANFRAITLTLPGSTPEAYRALAAYSSWLLNRLLQTIRDYKATIHNFGVWELQKRGALHIHLGIGANPAEVTMSELEQLGNKIAQKWFKLLKEMSTTKEISRGGKKGRLPGIDMFKLSDENSRKNGGIKSWRDRPDKWKWDNLPIKKNVAAYFSKYASKNVDSGNKFRVFNAYCPTRWWFCSKSISDKIKEFRCEYTVLVHPESIELVNEVLMTLPPSFEYQYPFEIRYGERLICEGYTQVFYWAKSMFKDVHEVFKFLKSVFAEIGSNRSVDNNKLRAIFTPNKTLLFKLRRSFEDVLAEFSIHCIDNNYLVLWKKYNHLSKAWTVSQFLSEFNSYEQSLNFVKTLAFSSKSSIINCNSY